MKKTVLFIAAIFQLWNMSAQSKCDSIRFYPDVHYLTQWDEQIFHDSMSYTGDNNLDYALGSYRLEDNQFISLSGTFATHGVTGPYEFKDVLGININYLQFVTPPDTEVKGFRILNHWSMTAGCEYPVTFIINPSIASDKKLKNEQTFKVYPNPANSVITIEFKEIKSGDIKIINALGNTIRQIADVSGHKINVETTDLGPGNYLIQLQQDGTIVDTQRLVITR